ncbi:hypothetical protein O6H91_Y430500 [Diphasiastrum complanatum]|nr:hypothetical protein O6H91_Y430500 [Diphasiastrum complanatum]
MKVSSEQVREILEGVFAEKFFSGLGSTGRTCPSCGEGRLSLKLSRYGSGFFFGCNLYPECQYKTNLLLGEDDETKQGDETLAAKAKTEQSTYMLGLDPKSGLQVKAKVGPFGPYVQLGESTAKQKPKRSTIPKSMRVEDIDLDTALEMLKYPRDLVSY